MRKYRGVIFLGKCNLNCWYCDKPNYEVQEDEVIESMKRIFSRFDKDDVCFRVECRGEITLYPTIIKFLDKKANEGYCIEILTNGLMLNNVLDENTKIHCSISIDGHTKLMNRHRRLSQQQVNKILDNIFKYNAEIQSVYLAQTMDEINTFIQYLLDKGFNTRMHMFPCSIKGKLISQTIDYDKLIKADFLPPKEYFDRWEYIIKNQKRDFVCDFFKNGYVYYIYNDTIEMIKCDGTPKCQDYRLPFGEEIEYDDYPCGTCINHNEYNNIRNIVNKRC